MSATLRWNLLAFAGGLLLACQGPRLPDGSLCEADDRCAAGACELVDFDCSAGACRQRGYCPGSACSDDADCEPGWACELVQTHSGSFLGILDDDEYGHRCVPGCDPCPERFTCDGDACVYDPHWAADGAPLVSLTAPAEVGVGTSVALDALATSPTDAAIASHVWHFHDGSTAEGASIAHTFTAAEAIAREELFSEFFYATVEVTDVAGEVTTATAEIRRCGAAGEVCEDSYDCCEGALACTPSADPSDEPNRGTCQPAQP